MKIIICKICKREKEVKPYLAGKQIYCGSKCKGKDKALTKIIAEKTSKTKIERWKKGMYKPPWNKGLSIRLSPKTEFKKGNKPWNSQLKGIRLSPSSEFKKGQKAINHSEVGTIRVRTQHGRERKYIKVAEPNKWQYHSIYVWEKVYGKVPKGMVIHHKDRNTLNDQLHNLDCLTRAEHIEEHRHELRV